MRRVKEGCEEIQETNASHIYAIPGRDLRGQNRCWVQRPGNANGKCKKPMCHRGGSIKAALLY